MGFTQTVMKYYINSKRLLFQSTKRPSRRELIITSRITALGVIFIGLIGFVVQLVVSFAIGK